MRCRKTRTMMEGDDFSDLGTLGNVNLGGVIRMKRRWGCIVRW